MKIWILSDLHLEFSGHDKLEIPDADICVVAGDVQNKGIVASLQWIDDRIAQHMPTIFVAGNHEFYRAEHIFMDEIIRGQGYEAKGQLHFLENSSLQIGETVFLAATMWTDFAVFGEEWTEMAMRNAATSMNDYKVIKVSKTPYQVLKPAHTLQKHTRSRDWLERALNAYFDKKVVVVTHHAPSIQSVEDRYLQDLLTPSFASNLEELMTPSNPAMWIHGHVHHHVDYVLNGTRVIANPRGYPREPCHQDYDFGFVVEI